MSEDVAWIACSALCCFFPSRCTFQGKVSESKQQHGYPGTPTIWVKIYPLMVLWAALTSRGHQEYGSSIPLSGHGSGMVLPQPLHRPQALAGTVLDIGEFGLAIDAVLGSEGCGRWCPLDRHWLICCITSLL